jgi:hypothetical protein
MKNLNDSKPIIFIHYGNSVYLRYTLSAAKMKNPKKRVILLGDESNKNVAETNKVEHYEFNNFDNGEELNLFNKVYKFIAGKEHGNPVWTNFVFKRWFLIHNFLRQNKINEFWTFDSDNIIMTDLADQEFKFVDYDCTEQCGGICMNGFVSNFQVVQGYVDKINELFQREDYLDDQRKEFLQYPKWAFTEMRAYKTYKEEENIKSIRLNTIINDETFDDTICASDGMETYSKRLNQHLIKKLYLSEDGNIFCYHIASKKLIKMNNLNMSFVPTYLYYPIYKHLHKSLNLETKKVNKREELKVLDIFKEPYLIKSKRFLDKVKKPLRALKNKI